MSRSAGIPVDAVAFYAELEANNTKDWWTANKDRYERSVREPVEALTAALADEFGDARIFRPYRDVRFSADKTPYKTEQGAIASAPGGAGYYLRIGSDGLVTGGGYMHGMPDQVARYRAALDDDASGQALVGIVDTLRRKGFEIGGETLATRPKGVAADHPRLELLRHKSLIAWRDRGTPVWMSTGSVVRYVRDDWRAIRPVVEWIGEYVGETTMPMPERGRRR
ncbi:MAG TPA: DUF2461 domain-containing protein [Lapillicoccus sp.]|nr:DUF2461 domain-containing protein [Lapillicoccus sp.]